MDTHLIRKQTPEERELEKKRAELATLETELADRELERATIQAELHAFEQGYMRIVGVRYAELDKIKAQIAEGRARLNPNNKTAQEEAGQARQQATASAGAAADAQAIEPRSKFKPNSNVWQPLKLSIASYWERRL